MVKITVPLRRVIMEPSTEPSVEEKLSGVTRPEMKKLPFTKGQGEMNYIADGVIFSAIARLSSLWGNFEAMPLTKRDIERERRFAAYR